MIRKLKGFTLVELIVVMAILPILMFAIMQMFKPVRDIYVDTTQYEAQRTVQNGVAQYLTESVRFSTDMGIYNKNVSSPADAVDAFAKAYCVSNKMIKADGTAIAPYKGTNEVKNIQDEIKKYADIIIIDNKTIHTYNSKQYWGRLIRRKLPAIPSVSASASVPAYSGLTSAPTADWRIALSEAYYGSNNFSIFLSVNDAAGDGKADDGVLGIAVASTRNGKRDISNIQNAGNFTGTPAAGVMNEEDTTNTFGQVTRGAVLCRNLVAQSNTGVTKVSNVNKAGIFDVSKYDNTLVTTKGTLTYVVFLNKDAKDEVDKVAKAAAATTP